MISIIVPTLNEEESLRFLLESLRRQTWSNFEILVVDGGSKDKTIDIAKQYNAETIVLNGGAEFHSRNVGAGLAKGEILLFTCADIIMPKDLIEKVYEKFERNYRIIAVSGPNIPHDTHIIGKVEYGLYNALRYISSKLPRPFKRFSSSTNFLVVRKNFFEKVGGFDPMDINADGLLGRNLSELGEVEFCLNMYVFISARRMNKMGFLNFNRHYFYVLENFFPPLSETRMMKSLKQKSGKIHRKIHEE
ncbi:MAG: glycosyltransferase [Candidatus Bathyarchaeota archaeon]|nr:glycosyltransferase [Candidatus Bathyarchaeota archaeon]